MAKVHVSSVINAPIGKVWDRIRDFNALSKWHPMIETGRIEDGRTGDSVGCVRNFTLKDGAVIREKLLTLSDAECLCTYSILEAPVPLHHYVATLRLRTVTDGNRTFGEWSAEFDTTSEKEMVELVTGVFQSGFDSLKKTFGG